MDNSRGYRGWMAALTVAVTLTLVILAVERHLRIPTAAFWKAPFTADSRGATTEPKGILLTVDPGLTGSVQFPASDLTPLARRSSGVESSTAANLLRRPPEPAANVVLRAPVMSSDFAKLPLQASDSSIDYLMEAIDLAFETPMKTVSTNRKIGKSTSFPTPRTGGSSLAAPATIDGRIPEPTRLFRELSELERLLELRQSWLSETATGRNPALVSRPVTSTGRPLDTLMTASPAEVSAISHWLSQTQLHLNRLIKFQGLEHAQSRAELSSLSVLAANAPAMGNALTDHDLAARLNVASYSLLRRVELWQAIQGCLEGSTISLHKPRGDGLARQDLLAAIRAVETHLGKTGDADRWRTYLLLNEMQQWLEGEAVGWTAASPLPLKSLARLRYQRLTAAQQRFLEQPAFEELASQLIVWGREPVDYRQLLANLEFFEENSLGRASQALASTVQLLRHSEHGSQQRVASVLNDHYRNANLRLSLSGDLIQRFLPNGASEIRPVRQRILGADTAGNSAVQTELKIKLIPDETAWNIDLGVLGDLVSNTRSSKGPAVFHNTSTAQINSHRFIRLDPHGYRVSSDATGVDSQDYLRRMSTDYDNLPVIGDFVRLIVREQFEQKRGLAQRITRRLIAQEADAELDRRLEEGLRQAERELSERIVGPLERMSLNPMVVSMNTTEDRLTIRYRVAHEAQMAAFTPRPRAPSDSLLSMQIHQSTLNNTIEQIGLSGKLWTLPDLFARLGEVFQQDDWTLPDDVPRDISIRFNELRPATLELVDGRLRLSLHIAELTQPDRLHIENFTVVSHYVPLADGLTAELLRDGVVEIESRINRDRFRLRVIFASIFVANPHIPLVAESWRTDPRATGLAVSQLEIRDGWLSIAVSEAGSEQAARVAERSRQLKLR